MSLAKEVTNYSRVKSGPPPDGLTDCLCPCQCLPKAQVWSLGEPTVAWTQQGTGQVDSHFYRVLLPLSIVRWGPANLILLTLWFSFLGQTLPGLTHTTIKYQFVIHIFGGLPHSPPNIPTTYICAFI